MDGDLDSGDHQRDLFSLEGYEKSLLTIWNFTKGDLDFLEG